MKGRGVGEQKRGPERPEVISLWIGKEGQWEGLKQEHGVPVPSIHLVTHSKYFLSTDYMLHN